MASIFAIEAVGEGIVRHLKRAWDLGPLAGTLSCEFKTVGAKSIQALDDDSHTCALYLHRITHNEFTRNQPDTAARRPAVVDLHYLFGLWLDAPGAEQRVLGWLLRELARNTVLDPGLLLAIGAFAVTDRLQFVPAELSIDDTSKLWQLLGLKYRPSLTYIVRNVQIVAEDVTAYAPVVATRYEYHDDPRAVAADEAGAGA